ncbi:uncharacterized protein Z520_07598 [Fonsecaea multimorphosa CBS 102226]|uniref:SUN domain-containing protein n=1 Tax=Fonsecaea multimorphosa CBS 102226 TaxID=1442371 RepID=A0A0D2KJZ1_9EURO|nr:uncharacterized protein Z520_07598 [Fonsecaea multimorphosa CBS 102226]KIX96878.1 hypothetical protein Z520_07598 [Fonsecaea multimorphosa CBS 102226]OAL22556.1 hypothetical protein AYO22_07114 [Fonsecaea multimorphosa]
MRFPEPVLFLFITLVAGTSSPSTTTLTPSTCPFRTVNYITHSLPQQCLASTRKTNLTSTTVDATASPSVDLAFPTSSAIDHSHATPSPSVLSTVHSQSTTDASAQPVHTWEEQSASSSSQTEVDVAPPGTGNDGSEEESPLEEGRFLSFEDWKRENLKKSGQSEHIGKGPGIEGREPRKRAASLRDSLDSLGDDAEIDLDFSGFVSDTLDPPNQVPPTVPQEIRDSSVEIELGRAPKAGVRSKDAGTTCKERFNYASFDCAANVLKTNPEARSASAVLGNNKDSYMLNECSAQNKFLILELCDDISIDTVVLANFEFFSSTFHTFRVSVSDKYPVKVDKWKTLGTFEARNTREVQAFLVENPVIWARYLRIEFLTHYGNEFYCPVSLVRVHGTTMLEEYKHDLESVQLEDEGKPEQESAENAEEDGLVPEAVAERLLTETDAVEEPVHTADPATASDLPGVQEPLLNHTQYPMVEGSQAPVSTSPALSSRMLNDLENHNHALGTCKTTEDGAGTTSHSLDQQNATHSSDTEATRLSTDVLVSSSLRPSNVTATSTDGSTTTSKSDPIVESTAANASSSPPTSNSSKASVSSTQSSHPAPTMQESFFKSVQKRLQMLESNSSLSLQYIEDQSRALRDAFHKVEQRQLAKTTSFLEHLNTTVLNELREFRQQYDQLWQSTVIELEMQRERYQKENIAINARLGVLADEVIFQKRMSFLQLILILICLGLVLFSKGNLNSYLELPLVQSVLSRSPSTRFMNAASPDTPSQNSPVSRSNSAGAARRRLGILKGHRRFPSEDSADNTMSSADLYSPPTPVSFGDPSSDGDDKEDSNQLGDPQFDPSLIERPSTSPPVLAGAEMSSDSEPGTGFVDDSIDNVLRGTSSSGIQTKPPILLVEDATPPPKHLKWQLPES